MQIVFQDPYRSLNPRRTVGASIIEGPMNFGVSAGEALGRAKDLMELVDLDPGSLGRYPHQFSGGQRQRVCIARALAMEPAVEIFGSPKHDYTRALLDAAPGKDFDFGQFDNEPRDSAQA